MPHLMPTDLEAVRLTPDTVASMKSFAADCLSGDSVSRERQDRLAKSVAILAHAIDTPLDWWIEEDLAQELGKEFHENRVWEWNEVAEFVLQRFPGLGSGVKYPVLGSKLT